MFDLGFQELMLVFIIALVVIGPQRMPGLVAKIGRWVGKARSMARQFREQLENEVNLDELNRMTEKRTKEARAQEASTPAPPYEVSGAPATNNSTTDDSYSHAHAHGAAPMPYTPEAAQFSPASPEVVLEPTPVESIAPSPAAPVEPTPDLPNNPTPDPQRV
jgi:sec-independent protein translocase protein TatB